MHGFLAAPLLALSPLWSSPLWPGLAPQDTAAPGSGVVEAATCALCHAESPAAVAMRDARGRSVAPYDLWRSTMMANSARDPFWRAVMSAEVAAAPTRAADIESKCLSCHAPLADRTGLEEHGTGTLAHALDCDGRLGSLARDGVSCTICHGMAPDGLGTEASFTAGFVLDPWRRLFGPHPDPVPGPMRMHSGFEPAEGAHVTTSAMCGSCHTLVTHALDETGADTGIEFLEQGPYLEWRNSIYDDERAEPGPHASTCQDCHVPRSDADGNEIETRLAHNPGGRDFPFLQPRAPFGRHLFVGGNTLMLAMLRDHAAELGVEAPAAAFDATLAATHEQLERRTASVRLRGAERLDGRLDFRVEVANRTGHKFPTGHPSRRAWLRVVVRDAAGATVAASGEVDDAGRIVDRHGAPLASELAGGPIEPHRDAVTSDAEVARFRAVMADSEGAATHTLLRGASWLVDDRLLPRGWSADHPDAAATRPVGVDGDASFAGGGDAVRYSFAVPELGPLTIEVELRYQSVSPRWVAELARTDTPEVRRFLRMWGAADRTPVVVARDEIEIGA